MKTLPEDLRGSLQEASSWNWGGIWRVNLRSLPGRREQGAQCEGRQNQTRQKEGRASHGGERLTSKLIVMGWGQFEMLWVVKPQRPRMISQTCSDLPYMSLHLTEAETLDLTSSS